MWNKKIGNEYERKAIKLFYDNGYWVHLFQQGINGQPCDLIAIKNNDIYFLDVKHEKDTRFSINRIEENQRLCFTRLIKCGVNPNNIGFLIYFDYLQGFRFLKFIDIKEEKSFLGDDLYEMFGS